ncbi:hypothetical protein MTO96_005698 [Rhipicephalus appendiculatus]
MTSPDGPAGDRRVGRGYLYARGGEGTARGRIGEGFLRGGREKGVKGGIAARGRMRPRNARDAGNAAAALAARWRHRPARNQRRQTIVVHRSDQSGS